VSGNVASSSNEVRSVCQIFGELTAPRSGIDETLELTTFGLPAFLQDLFALNAILQHCFQARAARRDRRPSEPEQKTSGGLAQDIHDSRCGNAHHRRSDKQKRRRCDTAQQANHLKSVMKLGVHPSLWRAVRYHCRSLRQIDKIWFDTLLPCSRQDPGQLNRPVTLLGTIFCGIRLEESRRAPECQRNAVTVVVDKSIEMTVLKLFKNPLQDFMQWSVRQLAARAPSINPSSIVIDFDTHMSLGTAAAQMAARLMHLTHRGRAATLFQERLSLDKRAGEVVKGRKQRFDSPTDAPSTVMILGIGYLVRPSAPITSSTASQISRLR